MSETLTRILIHIVFGTKNREPLITPEIRDQLYGYIRGILHRREATLFAIGGMPDHVHLLVQIDTRTSLGDLVQHIKGGSSKRIKENAATSFYWQRGYGAFSVSESNLVLVQRYIRNQERHHTHISFDRELIKLLTRHRVPFQERDLRE
jgi:putative transposase